MAALTNVSAVMSMLVGFFQTLLLVLAVSGAIKVASPDQAGRALVSARMVPGPINYRYKLSHIAARLLGLAEIGLAAGTFFLTQNQSLAACFAVGVAAMFIGFNLFIARLQALDPNADCGCFGASSAPPGPMHRVFNYMAAAVALAVFAVAVTTGDLPTLDSTLGQGWTATVPYLVTLLMGAALFLRGPSLVGELQNAIDHGNHDHSQANAFSIDHSALSPPPARGTETTNGRRVKGWRR